MMLELNKIYNENCLDTMARMDSDSIDCVVTSPPYYALRRYEIPDSFWGGAKDCEHNFESVKTARPNANGGKKGVQGGHRTLEIGQCFADYSDRATESAFCVVCKAWRGQLGLEPDFRLFIDHLILIFAEVKRVLKPSGTVWVNLGDSYSGSGNGQNDHKAEQRINGKCRVNQKGINTLRAELQSKSLMNIPSRFAIRMTDELGFIQRNQINWHKPAAMPSSAKDRFTVDFEPIFFFTKSKKYYFEQQFEPQKKESAERYNYAFGQSEKGAEYRKISGTAIGMREIKQEGRNHRTTWKIPYEPQSENHFASYPTKLIEIPIKAGCPVGGVVYDPFAGTGTTLLVAHRLGRQFVGSDLGAEYAGIMEERLMPELAQAKLF